MYPQFGHAQSCMVRTPYLVVNILLIYCSLSFIFILSLTCELHPQTHTHTPTHMHPHTTTQDSQHLLGQLSIWHEFCSTSGPVHCSPLWAGDGLSQRRVRILMPRPHVLLHCPHSVHSDQPPCTVRQKHPIMQFKSSKKQLTNKA